jgi:predicted DNA-binding transcriptional regulator AlpA
MNPPLTMTFGQVCEALGYPSTTCRSMIREGLLPGPIDDTLSPKRRRWSRAEIEAYVAGRPVGTRHLSVVPPIESDPTPSHGLQRPEVAS